MPESELIEEKLAKFGRSFALLFNRATIYEADHPFFEQSVDEFQQIVQDLVKSISPLVFIMNQDQFFVDEEPLDPRLNTSRLLAYFKKVEIQSISFYNGIDKNEMRILAEIFTSLKKYPDKKAIKKKLKDEGVRNLRINHVFFKKVASDEEVISRHALEKLSPQITDNTQVGSKKMLLDMVLESVLMEEFEKTLTIKNLVKNPVELSKNMIDADLTGYAKIDAEDQGPGLILAHQLQIIEEKVEENLSGNEDVNLPDVAKAVLDMKKQLIDDMETQKALGVAYSNEEMILDKANEITDKVLIQLVKDEYKGGQISTSRLAHILRRLVPEADELKRLLPKIKTALMEEGMPLSEYHNLMQELSRELQSEELSNILQESAEMIGVEGEDLIQKVRNNPVQAAELIFLAAEIRKSAGDENELTEILVDYVERIGAKLTLDIAEEKNVGDEHDLRQVMNGVESTIVNRLKGMDIQNDVLLSLEERLNNRIDKIFEKIKEDWISTQSSESEEDSRKNSSVLHILEQSVDDNEELGRILKRICTDVQSKRIDENDLEKIYAEIFKQRERNQAQRIKKKMPPGILSAKSLQFLIEKEISRATRYNLPFSALSFAVVMFKSETPEDSGRITNKLVIDAIVEKLSVNTRGPDLTGQLRDNHIVVLLPMTSQSEAKFALTRHLKILNTEPIEVANTRLNIRVAGVAASFEPDQMPDANTFLKKLSAELSDMATRIKNIHKLT
ncbi:MAG: hypothetical protein SVY10_09685 [Thermodesulfobacteriota bacterium]|nr:hypothetical protein [Thermodesulfobacteriota bacterium]